MIKYHTMYQLRQATLQHSVHWYSLLRMLCLNTDRPSSWSRSKSVQLIWFSYFLSLNYSIDYLSVVKGKRQVGVFLTLLSTSNIHTRLVQLSRLSLPRPFWKFYGEKCKIWLFWHLVKVIVTSVIKCTLLGCTTKYKVWG